MKKLLLLVTSVVMIGLTGCGGGGGDDSTPSRVTDVTAEFALQSGTSDTIDIEFIKKSTERVRLYLDHPSKVSTTLIDTSSKGTFRLACTQVVWFGDGRADYSCSGVGPDSKGELENISFRMTLWTNDIYELNTRYDSEPLWGGVTHTLKHNGPNDLTIVKK